MYISPHVQTKFSIYSKAKCQVQTLNSRGKAPHNKLTCIYCLSNRERPESKKQTWEQKGKKEGRKGGKKEREGKNPCER